MLSVTSRTNEKVRRVALLAQDAGERRSSGLCVAHGFKLCGEAARLGCAIEELWLTEEALGRFPGRCAALGAAAAQTVVMSVAVEDRLSDQRSPQGALAVVRIPLEADPAAAGRLVALCGVQDPANVGGALRTAAALGYAAALAGDSADPYSPKALRASMGAVFAVRPARCADGAGLARSLSGMGFATLAATLAPGASRLDELQKPGRPAIFIGSEGSGLSAEVAGACGAALTIPISDRAESLNAAAAAAILMWELRG